MKLALFGGTFDPVHNGHLAVARAAADGFGLKQVLFVPSGVPPHKHGAPLTPYHHRFAMLALATAADKRFLVSALEAPAEAGVASIAAGQQGPSYSIETVRRLKRTLGRRDRLYFLIGIDAFLDIAKWREPVALLREVEFIVAARPGFSLADLGSALPEQLRPSQAVLRAFRRTRPAGALALGEIAIHLLSRVQVNISATQVRAAARHRAVGRFLPAPVADYIRKTGLYSRAAV